MAIDLGEPDRSLAFQLRGQPWGWDEEAPAAGAASVSRSREIFGRILPQDHILPHYIACDLNGVFAYFQRISCWSSHIAISDRCKKSTRRSWKPRKCCRWTMRKRRCGMEGPLAFFSFRKSYVVSFWFILSYCCVYILVWIHKMIRVYRGNACLEHQKNLRKLALQQPGSQGKDTRIGVQPRSNSYRRSGFSRVFLEWSQVAKLWSKSWVHGLTRLCLFGWKWFGADMLGTSNYRYMFFLFTSGEFFVVWST